MNKLASALIVSLLVGTLATPAGAILPSAPATAFPVDCEGPAPDAEPATPEWHVRDANNILCTAQRHLDRAQHPLFAVRPPATVTDGYREPSRHDGVRFRFDTPDIPDVSATELYRPCPSDEQVCPDQPAELDRFDPPYPAAVLLHGGGSRKELHWWSSQTLAEAGYLVVTMDGAGQGSARAVLDWLEEQPDVDARRIGIAGHSIGGDAANIVAYEDERIGALVGWDRAGLSSPPADRTDTPPAIYLVSDYACPAPLVCPPRPYAEKPNPADRGAKTADFTLTSDGGVDTMQVALRGTTHFEWVPSALAGNRYGELLNVYYTITWFDRYLKGHLVGDEDEAERAMREAIALAAFERLVAEMFDGYVDRFNISQGFWDPVLAVETGDLLYGGNVPYSLEGMPVRDRLSFYFDSMCSLTVPRTSARAASEDMRAGGCAVVGG